MKRVWAILHFFTQFGFIVFTYLVIKSLFSSCTSFNPGHPDSEKKCLPRPVGVSPPLIIFHPHHKYYILVNKCSPTRKALAIIVNEGFTAALEGKKLPSTT